MPWRFTSSGDIPRQQGLWVEHLGNDRRRRRASYERDTLVAGVPQEVQLGAPEPSRVPQFMQ
jgi:hypothetical protein